MNGTLTTLATAAMLAVAAIQARATDLKQVDRLIEENGEYAKAEKMLQDALPEAGSDTEKGRILIRMSRLRFIAGEAAATKEEKRARFGEGIAYGEQAKKLSPGEPDAYMWHSANVGRDCQTRKLSEQLAALGDVMEDFTTILDKMKLDYAPAWQALAEIYDKHPFKSDDCAINFARKAVDAADERTVGMSTWLLLARLLNERGWSAEKRVGKAAEDREKFKSQTVPSEKYAYYDGSLDFNLKPRWSSKALGSLSDREEAAALVDYALALQARRTEKKTALNADDVKALQALRKEIK
ncbi:MAG: hypothetical protein MJY44_02285 [Bacteroidales bacterium]|nr:hypothetical protein [Bacteroidales bacterium]